MIDIIIPLYNARKTIERTLISVMEQKDIPQISVYLIDDQSNDDYLDLIEKYKDKLNLKYVRLDVNNGPGIARENGMNASEGEYIIFLDSDDIFYNEQSVNTLYGAITQSNCDVVRSVIYEETENGYNEYRNENIGLHGKIYRRSFLEVNNIHFNETRSNEDTGFNLLIKLCGANYFDISDVTYVWCNNPDSITRKDKKTYKDIDRLFYSINMCWAIKEADNRKKNFGEIARECIIQIVELYYRYIETIDDETKNKIKICAREIYGILASYNGFNIYDFITSYNLLEVYNEQQHYNSILWVTDGMVQLDFSKKQCKNIEYFVPTYNEFDMKIRNEHLRLMNTFNITDYGDYGKRYELQQKMFGSIGEYSEVVPPFEANWGGKNVYIGDGCYINFNCSMVDDANIYIGNNVFVGPNVNIVTVNHPVDPCLRERRVICKQEVYIGNNVWIGAGVIILPGVSIGNNSVIGAGSVVTKDIPENVLAVGNPCRIIREI